MKYIQKISAELDFIQHPINIDLKGRNLILTGKNGIGKTRFLNILNQTVTHKLISEIPHLAINYQTEKKQIIEYLKSIIVTYSFNQNYEKKLNNLTNFLGDSNCYDLDLNRKFILNSNSLKDELLEKSSGLPDNTNEFHHKNHIFNEIEHLLAVITSNQDSDTMKLSVSGIGDLQNNIQATKVTFNFFPAQRQSKIVSSTNTISLDEHINSAKFEYSSKLGQHLEQYLLNIRIEKSLALSEENNQKYADQINSWFEKFDKDLKFLFEDESTELKFEYKERKFSLKQSHREFTFQSLSSGFTAIFDIYSDLLMRSRLLNILPNELNGVVLIDEIDAHLHISLQKKILPFLTKSFPEVQFIVSTHSPFVITSTNNDTVVYDISSGDFFEEDLSLYSHESIIKELFHVKEENKNIKVLSDQLLQFIESENLTQDLNVIQELLNKINKDFEKLSVELQLQYMIAKNKFAKLKHEGK